MDCDRIVFSGHAIRRMALRKISRDEVLWVLAHGATIAEYPEDKPYPSRLISGIVSGRPIHVVAALDSGGGNCIVITTYEPAQSRPDKPE
jgi:hypothetical protein